MQAQVVNNSNCVSCVLRMRAAAVLVCSSRWHRGLIGKGRRLRLGEGAIEPVSGAARDWASCCGKQRAKEDGRGKLKLGRN